MIHMAHQKRERITFTATKIISKPAVISFHTKDGKEIVFRGHKDVPKPVKITFFSKMK